MGLVGKQDAIKQFYAQMETGKFRGVSQASARATKPQPAYRIDPNTNIVHLDEGYSIPPNTRTGDIGRIIRGRIRQFINQDFDLGESGIQARVTSDTINEVSNKQPSMRHWQFVKKGEMSNNFNELLYEATIVNEVDKLGNVLAYDISGIRKSTGRGLDGSAISADALDQSIDNSSIPNNPQDINDQIACKFLRRQIIGRNTLYEGNTRKAPVTPGELIEPGYNTEASDRNIAREAQNINDENDHATTRKSPMEPAGTSPSTELHHLGDSARNIAQESQNVDGGGNRASATQLARYDQNNTCAITLIGVHCSYSPLSKDCINI